MRATQDDAILTGIQRLLGLSTFSDANYRTELDRHSEVLNSDEQLNAGFLEQMRGAGFDKFRTCEEYQIWSKPETSSCVLFLSAFNNRSVVDLDHSWGSFAAISLIREPSLAFKHSVQAYYIFPPLGELLYRTFSVILLQLIRQKRQTLRNKSQYDELRAALEELQICERENRGVEEDEEDRLSALHKVALRVISFFEESETISIVLDRADRCRDFKKGPDHRKPLLETLAVMADAARCKLKVFVVIDGLLWDVERSWDELGKKTKVKILVHRAEQGYSV